MFRICMLVMLFVCGGTAHVAQAQTGHNHSAADAPIHDNFYSKWNNPNTQQSCCNKQDCYPTEAYFDMQQGLWVAKIRETGVYQTIPARVYDPRHPPTTTTPDGHAHVCAVPDTTGASLPATIHCFVPPEAKS